MRYGALLIKPLAAARRHTNVTASAISFTRRTGLQILLLVALPLPAQYWRAFFLRPMARVQNTVYSISARQEPVSTPNQRPTARDLAARPYCGSPQVAMGSPSTASVGATRQRFRAHGHVLQGRAANGYDLAQLARGAAGVTEGRTGCIRGRCEADRSGAEAMSSGNPRGWSPRFGRILDAQVRLVPVVIISSYLKFHSGIHFFAV
jgi:hypothetical protein